MPILPRREPFFFSARFCWYDLEEPTHTAQEAAFGSSLFFGGAFCYWLFCTFLLEWRKLTYVF